jgi:hypothetical protein
MRLSFLDIFVGILAVLSGVASAKEITVITWNLGWRLRQNEASQWIKECNGLFSKDATTNRWRPDPAGIKRGWDLRWGLNWVAGQLYQNLIKSW